MDELEKPYEFLKNVVTYDEQRDLRGFTTIGIKMGSVNWWLGLKTLFQSDVNDIDLSTHLPVTSTMTTDLQGASSNVDSTSTLTTRDRIATWVGQCQNLDGGVGPNTRHRSSLGASFQALSILCILGYLPSVKQSNQWITESFQGAASGEKWVDKEAPVCVNGSACPLDIPKLVKWVLSLKMKTRWGSAWQSYSDGPLLVENTAQVCIMATLLGCIELINTPDVKEFVHKCFNPDGGFGEIPGMESHGAFTYASLIVMNLLNDDFMNEEKRELLSMWLCARHLEDSGGFNGRPEKFPDVCYTWFIVASLAIMNKKEIIDVNKLSTFIKRSQDRDGGVADRPDNVPDLWHTWYGFAGLSLVSKDKEYIELSPVFCLPKNSLELIEVESIH